MRQNDLKRPEQAKTREEIAQEYGIHRRTFYRWLKKAGIEVTPGLISIKVLRTIYEEFGTPDSSND